MTSALDLGRGLATMTHTLAILSTTREKALASTHGTTALTMKGNGAMVVFMEAADMFAQVVTLTLVITMAISMDLAHTQDMPMDKLIECLGVCGKMMCQLVVSLEWCIASA